MDKLSFSYNWNNKLQCAVFTTIRLYNETKYRQGNHLEVFLKDEKLKNVIVVGNKKIMLKDINNYIGGIDTGYCGVKCREIIQKMYPKIDFNKQALSFVLLKTDAQ